MKIGIPLLAIFLAVLVSFSSQNVVAADCDWAKATYDSAKYIRVIRRGGSLYPISYLCWERSKIVGNIFTNVNNCVLAVSDEDGINCNLCQKGFLVRLGQCIKV